MAKNPTDFAQQNTERAVQVTNYGMNWMLEIAEQNLNQSKAALEGLLMITRKAVDGIDHQASVVRERSLLLAEETLSNTFDFAQKLVRMREPQELAQLQSEFVSRQAQALEIKPRNLGRPWRREPTTWRRPRCGRRPKRRVGNPKPRDELLNLGPRRHASWPGHSARRRRA